MIYFGDFYFLPLRATADLDAKSVRHQDKQTTRRNYASPVYVRIRGAACGTGHAAAAPAVIRTSCMLCRCAWDFGFVTVLTVLVLETENVGHFHPHEIVTVI